MADGNDWAQGVLETVLAETRLEGLDLTGLAYDATRQAYKVSLSYGERVFGMWMPVERLRSLQEDAPFARRKFRKEIERVFVPS
jgi:hypothetical protein